MFQVLLEKQNLIICFYNRLQQFGVKSMATIPLLWPLFLMSRHDIMSWTDISEDKDVVREVKGNFYRYILWYSEHTRFVLGKQLDQKNHLRYHVRTYISEADIPWNRQGKGLGAWPLCLKIILGHMLLGSVLKIDVTKTWNLHVHYVYFSWNLHVDYMQISPSLHLTNNVCIKHPKDRSKLWFCLSVHACTTIFFEKSI